MNKFDKKLFKKLIKEQNYKAYILSYSFVEIIDNNGIRHYFYGEFTAKLMCESPSYVLYWN